MTQQEAEAYCAAQMAGRNRNVNKKFTENPKRHPFGITELSITRLRTELYINAPSARLIEPARMVIAGHAPHTFVRVRTSPSAASFSGTQKMKPEGCK